MIKHQAPFHINFHTHPNILSITICIILTSFSPFFTPQIFKLHSIINRKSLSYSLILHFTHIFKINFHHNTQIPCYTRNHDNSQIFYSFFSYSSPYIIPKSLTTLSISPIFTFHYPPQISFSR